MKTLSLILIIAASITSFNAMANANDETYFQQYTLDNLNDVRQEKALCTMFDQEGNAIEKRIADVVLTEDDFAIVEIYTRPETHNKTVNVICR